MVASAYMIIKLDFIPWDLGTIKNLELNLV
jgi:hypothetical protein